jgi:trehalose/maltose hydrolase-like predicted phosphorylase
VPDGRVIRILTGEEEHHISADIAYGVWQYWRVTGDDEFMFNAGGEILIETARFWASRVSMEADGRAHIRGVIGPDEYHETVDDNAYTNVMAGWNLNRAAEAVTILKRDRPSDWTRLSGRVGLSVDEPAAWQRIAAALVTGFDPDTALFEQFDGYFELEEVDLAAHRNSLIPIEVWLGGERGSFGYPTIIEKIRLVVAHGEADAAILEFAERNATDLIALAWRGGVAPERARTMRRVISEASCPVIVFRVQT